MMIRKRLLMFAGASLLAMSGRANAQEDSVLTSQPKLQQQAPSIDPGSPSVSEIVVTAQRREQRLSEVPMSITAVTGQALEQRNITSVNDLTKLVPGLSVSYSGISIPIYTLRGVGVNETAIASSSSVAIYVDEVPLAYPIITQGASLDLARVEVLKGPQGTLYGENSTGGAINYIANKPTDTFQAGLTGSFGRFNDTLLEGYVSGPLAPTLKARFAARGERADGWQESITRPGDTLGKIERFTARGIVDWDPNAKLHFELNLNGWRDEGDTQAAQLELVSPAVPARVAPGVLQAPLAPNNDQAADWDAGRKFDRNNRMIQSSLRAQWQATEYVTLTSITALTHFREYQASDNDGLNQAVAENTIHGKIDAFSEEGRLAATFAGVNLILGGNIATGNTSESVLQYQPRSSQTYPTSDGDVILAAQKSSNWAIFTNIDVPLKYNFSLTGGLRYSEETRKFAGCITIPDAFSAPSQTAIVNAERAAGGLPALPTLGIGQCWSLYTSAAGAALDTKGLPPFVPGEANQTLNEHNLPWNINLNYKPSRNFMIYARIGRGYKAGNFATLAATNLAQYAPVVQESVTDYEIGTRMSPFRWISFEAAAFHYDYNNKQLQSRKIDPTFGNINAQVNIPASRINGVEASATIRPMRDLTFNVAATYVDAKVTRYVGVTANNVLNADFAGTDFNFTPATSINADLNYRRMLTGNLRGFVGIDYSYRSKTSSILAPPGIVGLGIYDIRAYSLLDMQVGVESSDGRWKAWLWGKNMTDEYYWTNVTSGSDVRVRYAGMPVTYGVTVSAKF